MMAESSNEASGWQSVEETECPPQAEFAQGFGPDNGGEFTIRSKENVEFHVHATILSLASPVFKDLMSVGSGERVVELTEDAQTIRLMLTYLYHQTTPQVDSFDLAVKGFEVARKYEIDAMTQWLKTLFRLETSPLYIRHHPLEVYDVASLYGFKDVADACYDHCIRKLDLEDEEEMARYTASRRDPRSALSLVSRLVKRRAIITRILFTGHLFPMNLLASQWKHTHLADRLLADKLICEKCRPPYADLFYSSVSWQTFWAHQAQEVLFSEPLVNCEQVFKIGFLAKPYDHEGTQTFCEQCFDLLQLRNHAVWEDWAGMARAYFGEQLNEKVFVD
ncbi:HMGL-like domain protein [Rhizoctonia solani AG-3 Rhs1AP]|uniref:HMGL-like domain protein n=1 Tax=Rhizoctonia solani AG-3 Rhs1AP TaxID=1086054 RepID=X8JMG2_9AGAM|nr:HMGL-like domain protein [Rhizoctonia solani AG-3 Rhs1AP]